MNDITIGNQALVIEHFGYWPSFHDAEVASVHLRRGELGYWPTISLWINVFGPARVLQTVAKAHSLWQLELEFTEVTDNELSGFNHQNVIFDITFQQDKDLISCPIDTSCGMSGSITARYVAVKSLVLANSE